MVMSVHNSTVEHTHVFIHSLIISRQEIEMKLQIFLSVVISMYPKQMLNSSKMSLRLGDFVRKMCNMLHRLSRDLDFQSDSFSWGLLCGGGYLPGWVTLRYVRSRRGHAPD